MKTKSSKPKQDSDNIIAREPWYNLTRENAWRKGWNAGYQEGKEKARLENEQKGISLSREIEAARRSALKDICQAGSSIVEGMTKALMSYDKTL